MNKVLWIVIGGVILGLMVFLFQAQRPSQPASPSGGGSFTQQESLAMTSPPNEPLPPIDSSDPKEINEDVPTVALSAPTEKEEVTTPPVLQDLPKGVPEVPQQLSIAAVARNPQSYAGKLVILQGKITTLCVRGCTFTLEDGTGAVVVELVGDALNNLVPRTGLGKWVEIQGKVELSGGLRVVVENPDGWKFVR